MNHAPHPRRASSDSMLDVYAIRFQLCVAVVLAGLLLLVHLPGTTSLERTPWGNNQWGREVTLYDLGGSFAETQVQPRVTVERAPPPPMTEARTEPAEEAPTGETPDAETPERPVVRSVATLGPDGVRPTVRGGMQRLYVNVEYPKRAIEERIEGRLILTFVVDEQGWTSDIQVARPLHPLCDSAAVQAVRRTAFEPARANGKPVPVRMSLPIQFQLIDIAGPEDAAPAPRGTAASRTTASRTPAPRTTDRGSNTPPPSDAPSGDSP